MLIVGSKKKIKKYIKVVALLLTFVLILVYFYSVSYPFVVELASAKTKAITIESINEALTKIRAYTVFNESFYNYIKNNSGDVIVVSANTKALNEFYIVCQAELQKSLSELNNKDLDVRLGAFTGSSIFAGIGPSIQMQISLVGASEALWSSYFYNEGINQTMHRTTLKVVTNVNILIPMKAKDITVTTEFVVAEDIIIGKVPETYLTGVKEDNIFDLIPG